MNFLYQMIPEEIIKAIGWTIFHSLWQGALISVVLGAIIFLTGKRSSQFKYKLSVSALALLLFSSIVTFTKVYEPSRKISASSFSSLITETNKELGNGGVPLSTQSLEGISQTIEQIKYYFGNHLPLIVTLWMIGLLIFSLRFIGGVIYVQRLKTYGIHSLSNEWAERVILLLLKANVKQVVKVWESALVRVPVALGHFKPVILLPLGMISGLPLNQIEAIIAHEIVHIKRYDFLVNLLQTITETIFFYHPAAWWISSVIRFERENCCDDLTIELCGDSLTYSKALVNLQELRRGESVLVLAATGKENQLYRRIKRMNGKNKNSLSYGIKFAAFILLTLVIAAASLYSSSTYAVKPTNVIQASLIDSFAPPVTNRTNFSSSENNAASISPDTTSLKKGQRTFQFYEGEKKNKVRYKAKLDDGKLKELYVDGEKVPQNDLEKYEGKINEKIKEYDMLKEDYNLKRREYKEIFKEYSEKMEEYRDKMKEFKLRHSDGDEDWDFDLDIDIPPIPDLSELHESIKELRKNLSHRSFVIPPIPPIHIPPIHIPPIKIDKEELENWKEEFKENMKDFKVEMKDFDVDMNKFKWDNNEFKESMKEFKKSMEKVKVELNKFKEFMNEMKDEMVKDGLIESRSGLDELTLSKEKMVVNGNKVSPELHQKYLNMYEKHTGKKLEGDEKIHINN